jgi:signal peptidase
VSDDEVRPEADATPPRGLTRVPSGGPDLDTDVPVPVFHAVGGGTENPAGTRPPATRREAAQASSKRNRRERTDADDDADLGPERGAFRTFLSIFGTVLLVLLCALAVAVAGVPAVMHGQALAVLTGSMEPTIKPGDLIVVEGLQSDSAKEDVKIGDIITYEPKADNPTLITHRVVAKGSGVSGNYLVTQGDNNNAQDAPVYMKQIVGKYLYKLPKLGYLTEWLGGSKRGAIMILGIALILFGIYRIVFGRKDKKARDAEEKAEFDAKVQAELKARLGEAPPDEPNAPPPSPAQPAAEATAAPKDAPASDTDPANPGTPEGDTVTHADAPASATDQTNLATPEGDAARNADPPASATPSDKATEPGAGERSASGASPAGVPLTRRQMREARERELAEQNTDKTK